MKNWTLPMRIGAGFGVVLVFLAGLAATGLIGLDSVVGNARAVIEGNRLDADLAQREVDHLNWAGEVSKLLSDDDVHELHVETDAHQCGLLMC